MGEPSPETTAAFRALLVAALSVFTLADLIILCLWGVGDLRRRPLLAPRWSVADVFVAFQAVLFVVLTAFCFGGLLAGMLAGPHAADPNAMSPAMMFAALLPAMFLQQVALVGVPVLLVYTKYRGSLLDLGIPVPSSAVRRHLALGAALALLLIPLSDLIETLSSHWLLESGRVPYAGLMRELAEQMSATQILDQLRHQPLALIPMVAIIGIIGPVAEEVFFRGFAYRAMKLRFGLWPAIVLSSLFFALVHGNPVAVLPIFAIGMALALTYERTGSLAAPIALHCTNNLLVVLLYFVAPGFSMWDWLLRR